MNFSPSLEHVESFRSRFGQRMFNRIVRSLLVLVTAFGTLTPAVRAQRMVKKLTNECPMGYIDTENGRCSALGLMTYTLRPSMGDECPAGWGAIGGGYCRRQ